MKKKFTCSVRELGSIPVSGRSPGEGNVYPLYYSCLENSMNRGAWQTIVHGVTKSWTQLSYYYTHTHTHTKLLEKGNRYYCYSQARNGDSFRVMNKCSSRLFLKPWRVIFKKHCLWNQSFEEYGLWWLRTNKMLMEVKDAEGNGKHLNKN